MASSEADLFIKLLGKEEFLKDPFIKNCGFTDKRIKFFRSVMDGNLKFVKKALNQGPIRKDRVLMRTSINLACRFGQSQVLDAIVDKVSGDFFTSDNFAFVVVLIAGVTESRRLQANQRPSGVLDILIKNAKKSYDKKTGKYIRGKIDFDGTKNVKSKFGFEESTTFFELCGVNNEHIEYIVRKMIDEKVVDVNVIFEDASLFSCNSALVSAALTGKKEVVKTLLDKMNWKDIKHKNEYQEHIQQFLLHLILDFSQCSLPTTTYYAGLLLEREDRMDIIYLLIEKCFRITENNFGRVNDNFMEFYFEKKMFIHDHFDAIIFEVIEEERRVAHGNGTLTWYDIETRKGPEEINFLDLGSHDEVFETLIRAFNISGQTFNRHGEAIDDDYLESLKNEKTDFFKQKCWSCGSRESNLLVCKQCRYARYCDALCQDEDWENHKTFCRAKKEKLDGIRAKETEEDRKDRKKFHELKKKHKQSVPGDCYDVETWRIEKKY